jgi:hypothetical protein
VGFPAIVENSFLRRRFATLDAILVKHAFDHGIWRSAVPKGIMIEVESDRRDRTTTDVRASPAAGLSEELNSDFEIRVFHQHMLA